MCDFLNLSQLFERKVFFGNEVLSLSPMGKKGVIKKHTPLLYFSNPRESTYLR